MAKFYGEIGYVRNEETAPGVWDEVIHERTYYGEVLKKRQRFGTSDTINNELTLDHQISILADTEAIENLFAIRYVKWMGVCFQVTNVEVQTPRLLLTIGGVYHGPTGWPTRGAV